MQEERTLEERLGVIEARNERVQLDKAWETSWARRILLTLFTYLVLGLYMWAIEISRPWLNSMVPALGFMISTFTIPWVKQRWIERRLKK